MKTQLFPNNVRDNEYIHNHVFRTSLTNDIFGDPFNLTATGGEKEATYSTTIDETWNPNKMHIVAFVFDSHEILQATRKAIGDPLEELYAVP